MVSKGDMWLMLRTRKRQGNTDMRKLGVVLLLLTPFSCTKAADHEEEFNIKDYAEGHYSNIVCEENFETCGIQGYTEYGIPVLLISNKVSDYFAPYGVLMWELPPEIMMRLWDAIADYELGVSWIGGVLPLEKKDTPLLTERVELRKERRIWIKRMTAGFPDQPERWLRLPPEKPKPKPEPKKKKVR